MKINMPVTDKEVLMKKGSLLVSRTDLKGHITYVNDAFIEISGFSRDELIGASHNIIRHPDMPTAAFEDLWATLKELRPWTAPVKNRTKTGDYYWVDANVMPVFKNGKVHEYLSVRRVPKREQIETAEALYKKLNANKAKMKPTGLAAVVKSIREIAVWKKEALALTAFLVPIFFLIYRLFLTQEYMLLTVVALSAIAASAISINLTRILSHTLDNTIGIFYRLAEKKFGNSIDLSRQDLVGDFYRGLYSMEVNLSLDLAESTQVASQALRINQALDNVQSSVFVLNSGFEIIYMNRSIQQMFKNVENNFRKQLPDFNADKLIGATIDVFQQPDLQRGKLEKLNSLFHTDQLIGNRHMSIDLNPVVDSTGERLGFVAEWRDRTEEVQIEQEIEALVTSIKGGELSKRINISGQQGFFKALGTEINELTDVIERAFNDINRVMESMAGGDLTSSINNEYYGVYAECKNNINDTMAKLSEFIIQIRDAANFIDHSSQEIASGNNNLSHRAEQQASNLEETAASMEELTSIVKNNADNAHQANEVANSAKHKAEKGGDVVNSAIAAMQEINESSNKIAEIISVIDEIAFQTNLLALNASVEAARAGEQGRGFSVVATEVRNLAQRSANAAKQSSELIQNSVQKVRAGTAFVNETGAALNDIVTSVAKVSDFVAQIAAASAEQSAGIEQVNQAVAQLDDITQQNAALAEQAAAGSISMSEQSTNMANLLNFFKVNAKANSRPNPAKAQKPEPNKLQNAPIKTVKRPETRALTQDLASADNEWEEF
ncbi:MAG: methyl-accepting chemotaxis protein [Methylobacter sp.]